MVLRGLNCRACCFFGQISPVLVFGFGGYEFSFWAPARAAGRHPLLCIYPRMTSRPEPLFYALSEAIAAALVFVVVFLRIESPVSVNRWWFCISRSSIASAIVASPIHSCQCSIGS